MSQSSPASRPPTQLLTPQWVGLLGIALLTSGFFHFYRLGTGEFMGEDEATVMIKVARQFLWREDILNIGAILSSSHPPLRMVIPTPLVGLFGPTEFWLRLPNALAGVLVCYWVFRIGARLFSAQVGILAAMLMAVSGMSGVYRSANGIGIFTLWLLIGLEFFSRALQTQIEQTERRYLLMAGAAFALATLTFLEGIVFAASCAGIYLWQRRSFRWRVVGPAILLYSAIFLAYLGIGVAAPWFLAQVQDVPAGNAEHLVARLTALGSINVLDFFNHAFSINSVPLTLMVGLGILLGIRGWDVNQSILVAFFLPHWLIWMFLLPLPNGHEVYAFPFWSILAAVGFQRVYASQRDIKRLRPTLTFVLAVTLVLAGWHNYMIFHLGRIDAPLWQGIVYFRQSGLAAGAPYFVHLGQPTAGVYIREHASQDSHILTNFGGSLEIYYAGRISSPWSLDEVRDSLDNPEEMREKNIRYLVLTGETFEELRSNGESTSSVSSSALETIKQPASIVTVDDIPTLRIYDLWQEPTATEILPDEVHRPRFYERYIGFRSLRPFLVSPSDHDG